jgi:4-hydroxybenzoate polyprenyltransferase
VITGDPSMAPCPSLSARLGAFAADIKLGHTIFAMPFALLSTFLAAGGWPKAGQLLLIVVCMVTARTVAMAVNRLLDADLDAKNPRTARRAIPAGLLSRPFVWTIVIVCAATFIGATALFRTRYDNPWPLYLSVPVLLFLSAYPLMKRFTRLCHYYLGAALALAPVCAWLAISAGLAIEPLLMAGAVLLWTAGFDIIYACQDYESDVKTGTFSVPARVGIAAALWIARLTHVGAAALLIALGLRSEPLSTLYFTGVACAIALLVVEHSLVSPTDLSKVNLAFFTINGVISLLLGVLGILDVFY